MSPETIVIIGGRRVVIDRYQWHGEVVIIPRVIMGKSVTENLGTLFAGRAWVNYDPSADYQKVTLIPGMYVQRAMDEIAAFLRVNGSLWRLPR